MVTAGDRAVEIARGLLSRSIGDASLAQRRRQRRLGRLLATPDGRNLILRLTDEVMRIDDRRAAARRFAALASGPGPEQLGRVDRLALRTAGAMAPAAPRVVMPLVRARVRHEVRGIVLPASDPSFRRFVERRTATGVRLNVNPLGEAVLSDAEAAARREQVRRHIERPDVDYVSLKISAIAANLDPLAFDHSVDAVCEHLGPIYRLAASTTPRTFVNLDMEEYDDLELTIAAFTRLLDQPDLRGVDAGIALQAYLPDSHDALERLGEWSARRHFDGGGRIKVRLVKGANLAMERVEAELNGWVPAPYATKAEVDASFKRMLDSALRPEWAEHVRVGVATHNLFDVAWAIVLTSLEGSSARVEFEMLEGMAPAQAEAVLGLVGGLLMYAPVVTRSDFNAAIAYLARRLDENTQPENFLRALFHLTPDSHEYVHQRDRFVRSLDERHTVDTTRRRGPRPPARRHPSSFQNEPNVDVTDAQVRHPIGDALGSAVHTDAARSIAAHHAVATVAEIDRMVATARSAVERGALGVASTRRGVLDSVAAVMASERVATMSVMAADAAKVVGESDPEISEAIDFCRYYGSIGIDDLEALDRAGLEVAPRGVVAVAAPWNFPCAIPTGGVAAALAAGNAVVLKPAPETLATGAWIADQFWRAGVPRDVLQLAACEDGPASRRLVTHPDVDAVVLTGAHDTAQRFLEWRPDMRLYAETSGKNAMVITAAADLDLAIADLVRSAFGHSGQKCSAASVAIITRALRDRTPFLDRLRDAVASLRVGAAGELPTMMGPLVSPPGEVLRRGLTTLETGERWLVEPRQLDDEGRLWSPGVRVGVAAGSWYHRTECFGPVLGVVCADDLDDAIEIQNSSAYGLTGGLHSLDATEIEEWLDRVEVGNAYVNRHTTGAVVQRQPFGGWKRSSVGGGVKTGGPSYVRQFVSIGEAERSVEEADVSYAHAWRRIYAAEHDPSGLRSERNVLRYRPVERVIVRHDGSDPTGLALIRLAAARAGVDLRESDARRESERQMAPVVRHADRLRVLMPIGDDIRRECHLRNVPVDDSMPVTDGRVELIRWVREQAISQTMHRHGRIITDR